MGKLLAFFNIRDVFCLVGFVALYLGVSWRFGHDIGFIVVGLLILAKGYKPWV